MEECKTKRWYQSKTLWVNILAMIASILQAKYGLVIPGELQGVILTALNIWLRFETTGEITTGKPPEATQPSTEKPSVTTQPIDNREIT